MNIYLPIVNLAELVFFFSFFIAKYLLDKYFDGLLSALL
jgi:hypothetical protein